MAPDKALRRNKANLGLAKTHVKTHVLRVGKNVESRNSSRRVD